VHEYVLGILDRLGIDESSITKLQTGGPDGDLGSNEILISKDKTIGLLDAMGTVFDPHGLDRDELARLADGRLTVDEFDTSKLSADGAYVSVDDENVTLPDGTFVESGLMFRNEFHFSPLAKADLFVPCGGRPQSVNSSNVHQLIDEDGTPRFKYIVEGANLFFTAEARSAMEAAGAILFKDASANKGGVTCSSFEVLAALCMSDDEHAEHMCCDEGPNPTLPDFYNAYVEEVIDIIESNARLEFDVIWKESMREGVTTPRHVLTDQVSNKINELNVACQASDLLDQPRMRMSIMKRAIPLTLQDKVGLETIVSRLPEDYIKAVLGYWVASRYVYKHGLQGNEFAFFEFMLEHGTDEL
jgi:glutamate dehydrogenase